MKEDKQIDELFRSKLEGFEIKPPAYVWDGIVEKQQAARRKKRALWIRLTAVAASVLLAFLLGKELRNDRSEIAGGQTVAEQIRSSEGNNTIEDEKTEPLPLAESGRVSGANSPDFAQVEEGEKTPSEVRTLVRVDRSKQFAERTFLPETTGTDNFVSFGFAILKKRISQFAELNPPTEQLESTPETKNESFLTEEDRLIVEKNRQLLLSEKDGHKDLGWTLGARVNPVLAVNESRYSQQYAANMNSSTESRNMQLGGGLTVAVETRGRWSFQSGVMYNRIGQSSSNSVSQGNNSFGFAVGEAATSGYFRAGESTGGTLVIQAPAGRIVMNALPQNAIIAADFEENAISASNDVFMTASEFVQVFDYLEIPLLVRYRLIDRKFGVQLTAGLNAGFLIGNSAYMNSGNGRANIGKTSDMNSVSYSSNFGFGLGYKLSPRLQLRFEPQWRYYLESLSNNPDVTYKPYSFNFYTGISYSF